MQTFSQLTYEAFLAYALPGLTALSPFLYWWYTRSGVPQGATRITLLLLVVSIAAILIGALIDMAAHVFFANWRRSRKQAVYWNAPATSSLLQSLLRTHYPGSANWSEDERSAVIDAFSINNISSHMFSRRNWDYTLHDASRNLLIGTALLAVGSVLAYARAVIPLEVLLVIVVGVIAVGYISLWPYMSWSINQCYSYNVMVALNCLLDRATSSDSMVQELRAQDLRSRNGA